MNDEQRKAYWAKQGNPHSGKIIYNEHIDKLPKIIKTDDFPKGHYGFNGIGNSQTEDYKRMMDDLEMKAIDKDFDNPIKHTLNYEASNSDFKDIDRFNVKSRIKAIEEAHNEGVKTKNSENWLRFLKRYGNQFG